MLMRTKVRKIYYMGEIEDATTVMMLNEHTKNHKDDGFEVIHLKT
jgi:hypothetical protein